jgi:hypothetical protein
MVLEGQEVQLVQQEILERSATQETPVLMALVVQVVHEEMQAILEELVTQEILEITELLVTPVQLVMLVLEEVELLLRHELVSIPVVVVVPRVEAQEAQDVLPYLVVVEVLAVAQVVDQVVQVVMDPGRLDVFVLLAVAVAVEAAQVIQEAQVALVPLV